ncbi:type II toxin-antitoxin system VapB family antitoxin [Streptomyces sp. NPDC026673]|uniref:type II toxin-antitoxin system VapB family antitoxin n=1 Tax=Streptomyces sp. NPDC026673 TaxID=3155724 RepID=UPI0033F5951C
MARTVVDLDDAMLAFAQRQLGTKTKRETINLALSTAAGTSADDRARGLAWLQEHAEDVLDFDYLAEQERGGR